MRFNFFLSFLTVFFGGNQSFSQSPDMLIKEFMNEGKVPGVFVAVVKNDSVLFEKAYGIADIVQGTPVTNKTCMELGSGREIYYSLEIKKMKEIDKWLNQFRKIWETRFIQLDKVLSTIKKQKK